MKKLTKAQQRQIDLLSDGKKHNTYNNGIKGFNHSSLDSLVKLGIVTKEKDVNRGREIHQFGKEYIFHPDRDLMFQLSA